MCMLHICLNLHHGILLHELNMCTLDQRFNCFVPVGHAATPRVPQSFSYIIFIIFIITIHDICGVNNKIIFNFFTFIVIYTIHPLVGYTVILIFVTYDSPCIEP